MPLYRRVLPLAWSFLAAVPLPAQSPPAVPEPLRPWVPWVLAQHPDLPCPLVDGERLCAWPGRLALDLDDGGGTFTVEAVADRELDLPLPGSPTHWPEEVTDDGGDALMRRLGEVPAARLGPGRHRLGGRWRWSRLPETLPVPPAYALVDLKLRGAAVAEPRREDDGTLWLARDRRQEDERDRVEIEVERLLEDGVPVTLTTRLRLRVSGGARAVELASPLPAGFIPTGLGGELPLSLAGGTLLVVQVRPGTWEVTLRARAAGPVREIALAERAGAAGVEWPERELWAFRAAPDVRAVRVSGAPGIDPQRTELPEEWRSLPIYQLTPGATLLFEELRRGQPEPPPDGVQLRRTWWLEQAGDRYTARDVLSGELFQGGRLEALAPAELGRFALGAGERGQVITEWDGGTGVEVRDAALQAVAELTYPRRGALPAVGWNRDVQSLHVALRVPPGWTLLAAPGTDRAGGSWLDEWTLLDLFLLLILSLATWRLDGRLRGLLAFAFLALAWHEPRATALWCWWLALLPLRGLLLVLPAERARLVRGLRWAVLAAFTFQLVVFCADQWRTGLFPQLEHKPLGPDAVYMRFMYSGWWRDEVVENAIPRPKAPAAPREAGLAPAVDTTIDADAVVQTGAGVPSWQWKSYDLTWNGPVTAEQTLRLFFVSPGVEGLLSLLRIAAVVLIAWGLIDPRRTTGAAAAKATPAVAAGLVLLGLLGTAPAQAQEPAESPDPIDLLAELERRLTAPPACHPDCVEVPRLVLAADAGGLRVTADVHAAADGAWTLPGPAAAWTPARVTVDGERAVALRRGDDGFFRLRLAAGVHQVVLAGPARDSVSLEFPLRPRTLEWQGEGWTVDGWRPDEPPPGALRLDRQLPLAAEAGAAAFAPEPWLELHRRLDVGVKWLVRSELRRHGPPGEVVRARVPLWPGESLTTAGIPVENGEALVGLDPGETVRRFESTLAETAVLELTAPADRPWLERWELACSPIWHCTAPSGGIGGESTAPSVGEGTAAGLAPVRHMDEGVWRPLWLPWPGESVTLAFARPAAAAGRTTTFDRAELTVSLGRRLLEADLTLAARASQGGEQAIRLPAEAALQAFAIDGRPHPVQGDGGRFAFSLEPGDHKVTVSWRQDHRTGFFERAPAVDLGGEAVDVILRLEVPPNRWLLWTGGPGWGPVVLFWQHLLVLALAAWALGRWAPAPLAWYDWLLLAAGLRQVPLAAAATVVAWLLALAVRRRLEPRRWWTYDGLQLALLVAGLIAVGVLYAAVHSGLLFPPQMQVLAPGAVRSSSASLAWYVDRAAEGLPRPWILSLPLWVWRVLMLLWSLWLASRVLRWAPWAWERLTVGPLLASPKAFARWREGMSA